MFRERYVDPKFRQLVHYEKGIKVSDDELAKVHLAPHRFHGDWNYDISSR